jgi:hypothetical protein
MTNIMTILDFAVHPTSLVFLSREVSICTGSIIIAFPG